MTRNRLPPLYALAILLYTLLLSLDLFFSWTNSPFEYYTWITFIIWTLPILFFWVGSQSKSGTCNTILLISALIISTLGTIGSINAFQHVGLAIALTSFLPFTLNLIPWCLTSISWMPAMGWFLSRNIPSYNLAIRIILATIGTIWILKINTRREA